MTRPPERSRRSPASPSPCATGGCGGSGSAPRSPSTPPHAGRAHRGELDLHCAEPRARGRALTPSRPPRCRRCPPAPPVRRPRSCAATRCCTATCAPARDAAATLDELATLATPGLAAQLRRAALSARAAVARGLPEPARAVGAIASLELAPAHGSTQTGLVVLVERTAIAHQGHDRAGARRVHGPARAHAWRLARRLLPACPPSTLD